MSSQRPQSPTPPSQKGIDFRKALEILSMRSAEDSASTKGNDENSTRGKSSGLNGAKPMGQVIDLFGNDKATGCDSSEVQEKKRKKMEEERIKRRSEIEQKLQSMSAKDLINAVLEAQQQRVATYRTFESGLKDMLETRNVSNYPVICAEATASFSVLSDTIKAIQAILTETYGRKDAKELIDRLQKHEREKLNLTAALHLEEIRARSEEVEPSGGNERILTLLREGNKSLRGKLAECVEDINDVLEELRYCLMEED